jgi:hypothetical protein|tara:strand:+ start:341 stop:508 length:168 start_codon:yes stop_codon:yes gene_type:complete
MIKIEIKLEKAAEEVAEGLAEEFFNYIRASNEVRRISVETRGYGRDVWRLESKHG